MSSRLFQEVREQRGLAYSVFSYHSSYQDSGLLAIYAGTGNNQLDLLFETIQETIDKLKEDGITEKELNNSKEQMKGSLMLGLESTNSRMSRNGKNELLLGRHRSLDEIIEEINSVTVEKVNELARSIFNEAKMPAKMQAFFYLLHLTIIKRKGEDTVRLSELSGKEIVDARRAERLGVLGQTDLEINEQTGQTIFLSG